jgi:5-methylcytosine-specific restriction protein A
LSRKQFILSNGATCINWNWSWSFINEKEKFIIFGAWQNHTEGNTALIFDVAWEINDKGRKSPGYQQSLDHIRLIESGLYSLKIFPMIMAERNDVDPPKIKEIIKQLQTALLKNVGGKWYASWGEQALFIPEEIEPNKTFPEGASKTVTINAYERNSKAKVACIKFYGYICAVCNRKLSDTYGNIASQIIHVHHLVPISEIKKEYQLDPIRDLRPVCPNCHAVIHSTQPALTIEELKAHLSSANPKH